MKTNSAPTESDALLAEAKTLEGTPFDYIVVGSGAGGGPLAARLALEGRSVLVIEAGVDPATGTEMADPAIGPNAMRKVYAVPCYNGASTEDPDISWQFSVRHYADDKRQRQDRKYIRGKDPSVKNKGDPRGGIFYPRASALGGCTAHHAMVIVRPNDDDWDRIAKETGDESWHSDNMQGYFAKIEQCLYYKVYKGFIGRLLGGLLRVVQWIATLINPKRQLDPGGHGSAGWQKTSFIDPAVILGILRDRTFFSLLFDVMWSALAQKTESSRMKRWLGRLQVLQFVDPNVRSSDFPTRESRLSLIPIGTDGGSRCGLREHLLEVARKHPDRLVLKTGMHVTRVLFENRDGDGAPRAVGVEVAEGLHLYGASPRSGVAAKARGKERLNYFARREVILAGGTFNTPQLLMLSGIGDAAHLKKMGIEGPRDGAGQSVADRIDLPAVGANLQDRYEVSVISEAREGFSTLDGALFDPARPDPVFEQWRRDKTGLYTTNGCALAMMISSEANRSVRGEPDLFIFGVPAAFRGYYWGWSRGLLRATKGAKNEQRNLWSWVILKAYTHNNRGTVRLHSLDPFAPPEIIFNSFSNADPQGTAEDVAALRDGVRQIREINRCIDVLSGEIQPGPQNPDGSRQLDDWLQSQAWGHHACGTCRIGADHWQVDPRNLKDPTAVVLDSKFRVHGVHGLRVVDASVFPRIPGYFIVTSVFMVSEKAADTLLAESREYPGALEHAEAAALQARRVAAGREEPADRTPTTLPQDAVGLALSGGGIRSATFCLGVLQALAVRGRLRDIDFLSTVSGGGCAGGFVGRLFTRLKEDVNDRVGRIQEILANTASPEVWWLRRNADYIASAGLADVETNLAVVARNLGAVHFLVGALLFAAFGGLRWLADAYGDLVPTWTFWQIEVSFWWWVPLAVLIGAVLPFAVGYWLTPSVGRKYAIVPLLLWVALLASAVYGLAVPGATLWSGAAIGALLLGWLLQEVTRWRVDRESRASAEPAAESARDGVPSTLVRNRLTRALGAVLLALAVSILWVVLDSLARLAASGGMTLPKGWSMLGTAPLVLLLRLGAAAWLKRGPGDGATQSYEWVRKAIVGGLAFVLAALLLFFLDLLTHLAFDASNLIAAWTAITALVGSIIVGRWFRFLNLSSLQQSYGQKLVRTFLGASNDARVHPTGADDPMPVEIPSKDDDVFFDDYHPERNGGPLHLINTCVNDTVAGDSGRQLRDDKGLPMCVGPAGVSVGRRYHALWESRSYAVSIDQSTLRPLPVAPDPNAFHVLGRSDNANPEVERLPVGQWIAISAAAVATGAGRFTNVAQSLLLGLLNLRVGYWWDSGIRAGKRPGRYPPNLWRRLKSLPASIVRMQATLLNEWRGYFPGPAERLWYLSDGGHFENSGLYELFRRRLPFIIAIDGGQDEGYQLDDLAILTRQVRLDFGAKIRWLDPTLSRASRRGGWIPFDEALGSEVPELVQSFIEPNAVGALTNLKREAASCSALAHVTYANDPGRESWLLLLKANLAPPMPVDVRNYAVQHPAFPNESTAEQFFRDDQWESYRALGQCAGEMVFRASDRMAQGAVAQRPLPPQGPLPPKRPSPPKPVEVRKLSVWDTLRVQWHVSIPSFFRGVVAANRWFLWWRSRSGGGWQTMHFLRGLPAKYGSDHLWSWFPVWAWLPVRRTLFVFAPETMKAVFVSDENAADPLLKVRALSRFIPEALVISSGDEWRDRRDFNVEVLALERPHPHHGAFRDIVFSEAERLPPKGSAELGWSDFHGLGTRISQQVILGAGQLRPSMAVQLERLVSWSNLLSRDESAFAAFHRQIVTDLKNPASADCLMADSAAAPATETTRVPSQIGFWFFVLNDALELHVPRTLALIAAHPEVQERVRHELLAAGKLTAAAIDGLSYLEACLREQLRLWTPVPLLLRRALHAFSLNGEIPIAAEQQILIHAGFYHRDARVFGRRADRFSPDDLGNNFPDTYFFSADRQGCAGKSLVTFVLKAALASLLSRFRFELIGPTIEPDHIPYLYDHFSVRLQTI